MSLPAPPLLVISDRRQARRPLESVLAAALAGGCRWLLLREKDLSAAAQSALARRLLRLTRPAGAKLLIGAEVAVARASGADGVHLPRAGDVAAARAALGPGALIGRSAHDLAEAAQAARAGADYVTLSPVFGSASKPGYGPALGPAGLAAVCGALDLPVLALGGVSAERAAACLDAGAAGVAVMGAVMRAANPEAETRRHVAALAAHAPGARQGCGT